MRFHVQRATSERVSTLNRRLCDRLSHGKPNERVKDEVEEKRRKARIHTHTQNRFPLSSSSSRCARVFGTNENTSRYGLTCLQKQRKRERERGGPRNILANFSLPTTYKRCESFLPRRRFSPFFFFIFFFAARKRRKSFSAPAATTLLDTIPWKSSASTKSRSYIDGNAPVIVS